MCGRRGEAFYPDALDFIVFDVTDKGSSHVMGGTFDSRRLKGQDGNWQEDSSPCLRKAGGGVGVGGWWW